MPCATCRYIGRSVGPLTATGLYPCKAPHDPQTIPLASINDKGEVGMRRKVFVGYGEGCKAYEATMLIRVSAKGTGGSVLSGVGDGPI